MNLDTLSRAARLGAELVGARDEDVASLFNEKTILVRLEPRFTRSSDAHEILLFSVNQLLRFCPRVSLSIEGHDAGLIRICNELAFQIHGPHARIGVAQPRDWASFDAVLNIGTSVLPPRNWATVNSSGWIARLATGHEELKTLPWNETKSNPIGALGAACLGVSAVFFTILGKPIKAFAEISLFSHESGAPGTLTDGPALPKRPVLLDGFLVGCGAVSNGWAYAVKRLPIIGNLQAIDRQSLRPENLGPYVAATREFLGKPKALLIKALLAPGIEVVDRADHWELFKLRLLNELKVPPIIISGLDNVGTRHSVQRIWPKTLIDMGAQGLESQLIIKNAKSDGQCILNALTLPADEIGWADAGASLTGMAPELIASDPTGQITQREVDAAPFDRKRQLQGALGKPRCGYLNHLTLKLEQANPNFAPAVPFVTAFTGLLGASETMKLLMHPRFSHSLHFQRSFRSGNSRALRMFCDATCECQKVAHSTSNVPFSPANHSIHSS